MLSRTLSSPHSPVALQCVPVAYQHRPPGGPTVAALQDLLQPALNGGEVLSQKEPAEKLLRQLQRMGTVKAQNLLGLLTDLKGHLEGTVDGSVGVVRIGAGLPNDKIAPDVRAAAVLGLVCFGHGRPSQPSAAAGSVYSRPRASATPGKVHLPRQQFSPASSPGSSLQAATPFSASSSP